jgi:hypothetical protein
MLAQVFNTTVDSIMELNPGIEPRSLMIGHVLTIRPGYQYSSQNPMTPSEPTEMESDMTDQIRMDQNRTDQNRMDQNRMNQNRMDQNRMDQNRMGQNRMDHDRMDHNMMDHNMMDEMEGNTMDLRDYFRLLWDQHVEWTRMAVMGIVHNLPESDLITKRLLRNPTDFANALAPFYGEANAQKFDQLLSDHLTIAAEIVKAAMANDSNAVTDADKRWHANAEAIAAFLASLNPYWKEEDWSAMLKEHLDLLSENVDQMVSGDYEDSINGYDDMELQALEMADMMSEGIAMQYPY